MVKKAKKTTGRPTSYKTKFAEVAGRLCREKGYTDKNLATHFKVSERTINNWKSEYLQFLQSLKKGKDDFDSHVVEQALLKRAVGYSYVETTRELQADSGELFDEDSDSDIQTLVVTKKVTKQIAADVTAQIFWLKNRKPERWSDKHEFTGSIEIKETLTFEVMEKRMHATKKAGTGIDNRSIKGGSNTS